MPNPADSMRQWLAKRDTVTIKELDQRLTCDKKQLAFLLSDLLRRSTIQSDERISAKILTRNFEKLRPYLPTSLNDHAILYDKRKAARPPKRAVARREESAKEGEMLPEFGRRGFRPTGIWQ